MAPVQNFISDVNECAQDTLFFVLVPKKECSAPCSAQIFGEVSEKEQFVEEKDVNAISSSSIARK